MQSLSEIAHLYQSKDGNWVEHKLSDHCSDVAQLASALISDCTAEVAYLAGLWHDLGKYQPRFQQYIRNASGFERENAHVETKTAPARAPHSTAGAIHATTQLKNHPAGQILAYLIAGHHAGLPDGKRAEIKPRASLEVRLAESIDEYQAALEFAPKDLTEQPAPSLNGLPCTLATDYHIWIRMLFSALVDADFLDTESFMSPHRKQQRKGAEKSLNLLNASLERQLARFSNTNPGTVNTAREAILEQCQKAALWQPGLFSLSAPTGGGKTLSSLSWALRHAIEHNKRRIIIAIPYTSIIEQTASVYRDILGNDQVLEHHSNLEPDNTPQSARARLAAENWDAPVIVTTNVQLFESLFAARTSRCRKLHNIRHSVIVLDEAQQLPGQLLAPITSAIDTLQRHHGVSWLFCTATQPALDHNQGKHGMPAFSSLTGIREILTDPDPLTLAKQLKRVTVELPSANAQRESAESLAEQLCKEPRALAIVSTRRDAAELFHACRHHPHVIHLSASMCAAHREHTLFQARKLLRDSNDPLLIVATNLIEAGVDISLPVVYRALAGLDSIAQAAGRCNREGELQGLGRVVVFNPPRDAPPGLLRHAQQVTRDMLPDITEDPLEPTALRRFFERLHHRTDHDTKGIMELLSTNERLDNIQFRSAAAAFQMIDQSSQPIITPWCHTDSDESPVYEWLANLEKDSSQKWIYRHLQRYTVTVPEPLAERLQREGYVTPEGGLWLLNNNYYDPKRGLKLPDESLSAELSVI